MHNLIVVGQTDDGDSGMAFILRSVSPITERGVFDASEPASPSSDTGRSNVMWSRKNVGHYNVLGSQIIIDALEQATGIKTRLVVHITAIDGESVRGTFEGTAIGKSTATGDNYIPWTITNDEFYAPLISGD